MKNIHTSAKSVRFPHESEREPTQEKKNMEFRLRAAVLLSRINEWSSKEHWEHYFCEQKNWTLQSQLPTEPTQWQWIEWTKFLTATRASIMAAFSVLLSFQNLTTSILCSNAANRWSSRPNHSALGLSGPLSSVEKFDAKLAKDGNAAWNTKTPSVFQSSSWQTGSHQSTIYVCAQVGRYADRRGRIINKVSVPKLQME